MEASPRILHQLTVLPVDLLRLGAWLVLLLAIFVPLEKRWPVQRHKVFRKHFGVDLG
jgi:hypothetical protein